MILERTIFAASLFLFFLPKILFPQTVILDSLKIVLPTYENDTNKVELLCDIAFHLYELAPEESLGYSDEAFQLGKKLKYRKGVVKALYEIGLARMSQGKNDLAIEKITTALELAKREKLESRIANCLNVLGLIHLSESNYKQALDYFFESVKLSEASGKKVDMASAYHNVGKVYLENEDHLNAKKYFFKALENYKQIDDLFHLALTYNSLSTVEDDSRQKREYLKKSIEIGDQLHHDILVAYASANLGGDFWLVEKDTLQSLKYYRKSLAKANRAGEVSLTLMVEYEIGQLFLDIGMRDSAMVHLERSLILSDQVGNKDISSSSLKYLSQCYAQSKDFSKAYELLSESTDVRDTLFNQELAEKLADADAKYETSKKETQISNQQLEIERQKNSQNRILFGSFFAFLFALAIFLFFFFLQSSKKQVAELALQIEQKEAERLRELDRLKSSFFTNISHELRTPLTLVAAPLEDALQAVKPGVLKDHLQLAHSNTKKLLNLVNEILDLSKLEAGKLAAKTKEIALLPLFRRIFYSFQSIAQLRGLTLDFQSNIPSNLVVHLDEEKFEKILNNLLSNAVKFTDSGGNVRLKATHNGSVFHIEIEDSGRGIAPEELPRIFDRFFQSTAEDASLQGGSGIGLALAKELAQLLGGDLKVDSELGRGSRFHLELPLEKTTPAFEKTSLPSKVEISTEIAKKAGEPTYKPILLSGQKPRLLIVEDNPEMSQYIAQRLKTDYHCTIALDGMAALEKLQTQTFDLITSDVMMPNMDGFAFRQKVNEHAGWKRIPFIMLTARAMEEDKLRGFRLGVDDYLTKPFSIRELQARIHNLLTNKMERDNFAKMESEPEESPVLSADEQLLHDAEAHILKGMNDPQLNVEELAQTLHFSSRQLSRTLRKLTGMSPVQFILELRLQRALQLLESRRFHSVAEVRYQIGIESPSHFTTRFAERFGKNPKEYLAR